MNLPEWNEIVTFVVEALKKNEFFQAGGILAAAGLIWQYTRTAPMWLWGRIKRKITYTATIEETNEFFNYFEVWLRAHHKSTYRNVEVRLKESVNEEYPSVGGEEEKRKDDSLKLKQHEDMFFLKRGFGWIRISKGREKMENANNPLNLFFNRFVVSGIFAKNRINSLMEEVYQYNKKIESLLKEVKLKTYYNDSSYWNNGSKLSPKGIEDIIIKGKADLISDIKLFMGDREWYRKRSITYKRGYLFEGAPGNGKTVLALSIAKMLEKRLYLLNTTKSTDKDLINLFSNMESGSVLLVEDVDAIFGKNRTEKKSKFNFSTLLNCLDGAFAKEDTIVIFTTNHPERLDPALIRPGRIDYKFKVSNPEVSEIEKYLEIFYEKPIHLAGFQNKETPMVKIQDVCLQNKNNPKRAVLEIKNLLVSRSSSNGVATPELQTL